MFELADYLGDVPVRGRTRFSEGVMTAAAEVDAMARQDAGGAEVVGDDVADGLIGTGLRGHGVVSFPNQIVCGVADSSIWRDAIEFAVIRRICVAVQVDGHAPMKRARRIDGERDPHDAPGNGFFAAPAEYFAAPAVCETVRSEIHAAVQHTDAAARRGNPDEQR